MARYTPETVTVTGNIQFSTNPSSWKHETDPWLTVEFNRGVQPLTQEPVEIEVDGGTTKTTFRVSLAGIVPPTGVSSCLVFRLFAEHGDGRPRCHRIDQVAVPVLWSVGGWEWEGSSTQGNFHVHISCTGSLSSTPSPIRESLGTNRVDQEFHLLSHLFGAHTLLQPSFPPLKKFLSIAGRLPSGQIVPHDVYLALAERRSTTLEERETDPGLELRRRWHRQVHHVCGWDAEACTRGPPLNLYNPTLSHAATAWIAYRGDERGPRLETVATLALASVGVDQSWVRWAISKLAGLGPGAADDHGVLLRECSAPANWLCPYRRGKRSGVPMAGIQQLLSRVAGYVARTKAYLADGQWKDLGGRETFVPGDDHGSCNEGGKRAGLRGADDCEGLSREAVRQAGEFTDWFLCSVAAGAADTSHHFTAFLLGRLFLCFLPVCWDTGLCPIGPGSGARLERTGGEGVLNSAKELFHRMLGGSRSPTTPPTNCWTALAASGAQWTQTGDKYGGDAPGGHISAMLLPRDEGLLLFQGCALEDTPPCCRSTGTCVVPVPLVVVECTAELWSAATFGPDTELSLPIHLVGLHVRARVTAHNLTVTIPRPMNPLRFVGVEALFSGECALDPLTGGKGILLPLWNQPGRADGVRVWDVPIGPALLLSSPSRETASTPQGPLHPSLVEGHRPSQKAWADAREHTPGVSGRFSTLQVLSGQSVDLGRMTPSSAHPTAGGAPRPVTSFDRETQLRHAWSEIDGCLPSQCHRDPLVLSAAAAQTVRSRQERTRRAFHPFEVDQKRASPDDTRSMTPSAWLSVFEWASRRNMSVYSLRTQDGLESNEIVQPVEALAKHFQIPVLTERTLDTQELAVVACDFSRTTPRASPGSLLRHPAYTWVGVVAGEEPSTDKGILYWMDSWPLSGNDTASQIVIFLP
jgi:hypothetical protein